jgi:hypothetical protein
VIVFVNDIYVVQRATATAPTCGAVLEQRFQTEMRQMRKRLKMALLVTGFGLFALPAMAAEPVSIGNYGNDGDEVYYQVTCSDNTQGSVIVKSNPKQICALPAFGKETCRAVWTVKEAAAKACK